MSSSSSNSDGNNSTPSENVGIAFALVIGAGAATAIGAAVVFVPWAVKYANRKTLAASLGLSAGVMTYVSFVEIFAKSVDSFAAAGRDEKDAYLYGTLCFFGGVVFMVVRTCVRDVGGSGRLGVCLCFALVNM